MEIINVIAAALGCYAFGAAWYMVLSKQWMEASGVAVGGDGRPENASNPMPYVVAFISALIVAGMMRHVFTLSGIDTVAKGLMSGLGIGLFMASPWLMTCYGFAGRSRRLMVIDAGYITFGSMIIGVMLTLF